MIPLARLVNTNRLSASLLIRILLFSGFFTLIIVAVQLFLNYQNETEELERESQQFVENLKPSLARSVWELNYQQAIFITDGVMRTGLFKSVIVKDDAGNTITFLGKKTSRLIKSQSS